MVLRVVIFEAAKTSEERKENEEEGVACERNSYLGIK
jgi:hypothetical protein